MSSSISALPSNTTNSTSATGTPSGVKWQPGHYIKVPRNEYTHLLRDDGGKFAKFLNNDNVKGFEVLFYWRQLETAKGQYNFSEVTKVLDVLKEHGKHMIITVLDRSYWNGGQGVENPLPDYVYGMGGGAKLAGVSHRPDRNGVAAATWKGDVMDRYIGVFQALGRQFDRDPNFLGAQTTETALRTVEQYDKGVLRQQYERLVREGKAAMPHSMFIFDMNFLDDGRGRIATLTDIAEVAAQVGGSGLTTPDVVPSQGQDFSSYPIMHAFQDRVAIVSGADDSRRTAADTPDRIQLFAKNYLGANYIIWKGDLPANPIQLDTSLPSSFKSTFVPGRPSSGGSPTPTTPPTQPDDIIINPPQNKNGSGLKLVITPVDQSLVGSSQNNVPLIDLRQIDLNQDGKVDQRVSLKFNSIDSESRLSNSVGFYVVADEKGGVLASNSDQLLYPGDEGYAKAAVKQRIPATQLRDNQGTRTAQVDSGVLLAPYIISNGTPDQFLNKNPNNQRNKGVNAYFGYLGANPDKAKHIDFPGNNQFTFEDTWAGGNKDFNDFSFKVKANPA